VLRPGRLDLKIKVDRPGRNAASAILALHLTPNLPSEVVAIDERRVENVLLNFPPTVTARTLEVVAQNAPAGVHQRLLAAFGEEGDIRTQVVKNPEVHKLRNDLELWAFVEEAVRRERAAEKLILDTVEVLYHPASQIEVTSASGQSYTYAFAEFMSGAILVNIANRAKKEALKRHVAGNRSHRKGITLDDLRQSVEDEFIENAEHLILRKMDQDGDRLPILPRERAVMIKVKVVDKADGNRWTVEKSRPYQKHAVTAER
jgi:proteasome-associated ATPase